MKRTKEQKRGELMAKAAQMIDAVLAWEENQAEASFTELEDEVLARRAALSQRLLEVMVEGREGRQPVAQQYCAECGKAMVYKGQRQRGVESRVGSTRINRGHYYCSRCKRGFFPLGPGTGIEGQTVE